MIVILDREDAPVVSKPGQNSDLPRSQTPVWERGKSVPRPKTMAKPPSGPSHLLKAPSALRLAQGGPGSFEQARIPVARALEVEHTRRQVTGSPRTGGVVVVFQRRRAELVIVRVGALAEDEAAGRRQQSVRLDRLALHESHGLARRHHAIFADLGQDLLDRLRATGLQLRF